MNVSTVSTASSKCQEAARDRPLKVIRWLTTLREDDNIDQDGHAKPPRKCPTSQGADVMMWWTTTLVLRASWSLTKEHEDPEQVLRIRHRK